MEKINLITDRYTLCSQYNKAKEKKSILYYEAKYNRWLVSLNSKFKVFSHLIKDFRYV